MTLDDFKALIRASILENLDPTEDDMIDQMDLDRHSSSTDELFEDAAEELADMILSEELNEEDDTVDEERGRGSNVFTINTGKDSRIGALGAGVSADKFAKMSQEEQTKVITDFINRANQAIAARYYIKPKGGQKRPPSRVLRFLGVNNEEFAPYKQALKTIENELGKLDRKLAKQETVLDDPGSSEEKLTAANEKIGELEVVKAKILTKQDDTAQLIKDKLATLTDPAKVEAMAKEIANPEGFSVKSLLAITQDDGPQALNKLMNLLDSYKIIAYKGSTKSTPETDEEKLNEILNEMDEENKAKLYFMSLLKKGTIDRLPDESAVLGYYAMLSKGDKSVLDRLRDPDKQVYTEEELNESSGPFVSTHPWAYGPDDEWGEFTYSDEMESLAKMVADKMGGEVEGYGVEKGEIIVATNGIEYTVDRQGNVKDEKPSFTEEETPMLRGIEDGKFKPGDSVVFKGGANQTQMKVLRVRRDSGLELVTVVGPLGKTGEFEETQLIKVNQDNRNNMDPDEAQLADEDEMFNSYDDDGAPLEETLNEGKMNIKKIEEVGKCASVEAKLAYVNELIEEMTSRLTTLEEDEGMAEMMDKKKLKEMKKDIKLMERMKAKLEKEYAKLEGKGKAKEEAIIDEDEEINLEELANPINETSYKIGDQDVTLNKGEDPSGVDWTVTFPNGITIPLNDILALIKPFPDGLTAGSVGLFENTTLYKTMQRRAGIS